MKVCLLGASGSIGKQCIEVIKENPNDFELTSFSVGQKVEVVNKLLSTFSNVTDVCVKEEKAMKRLQKKYPDVRFHFGDNGLKELIHTKCDMVINALVGFVGLIPTIEALSNNKILALANKESLVVGGELINDLLSRGKGKLIPIDSEHVAIAKCLAVDKTNVNKIILTASGGPFRDLNKEELAHVTKEDALKHPNWKMGDKITIDSSTMMNKAFEIIEAYYLFGKVTKNIDVVINKESFVHSIVEYENGFYRFEANKPDMKRPIKWALFNGQAPFETYLSKDYKSFKNLTFMPLDKEKYPLINYGYFVIQKRGLAGTILNASNEIAVKYFLEGKISYLDIQKVIDHEFIDFRNTKRPTLKDIIACDLRTRKRCIKFIEGGLK